jgi:hypothetical protein
LNDPLGAIFKRLEKILEVGLPESLDWTGVVKTLQRQLVRLKRMADMLYEDKLAGEISAEGYGRKYAELTERIANVQERLDFIQRDAALKGRVERERSGSIVRLYLRGIPEEKRAIMAALFRPFRSDCDGVAIETI